MPKLLCNYFPNYLLMIANHIIMFYASVPNNLIGLNYCWNIFLCLRDYFLVFSCYHNLFLLNPLILHLLIIITFHIIEHLTNFCKEIMTSAASQPAIPTLHVICQSTVGFRKTEDLYRQTGLE